MLGYVGGADGHTLDDPIYGVSLVALYGGVALYLLGHSAFKWRTTKMVHWQRLVVAVVLLALIPVVSSLPALLTLAVVTALMTAVIVYETVRYAEFREQVRHDPAHEE